MMEIESGDVVIMDGVIGVYDHKEGDSHKLSLSLLDVLLVQQAAEETVRMFSDRIENI